MQNDSYAPQILGTLTDLYPDADCELNYQTPFQLLVATVLSAQTTDVRVNQITPELFAKFPLVEDLAAANPEEIEKIVRPLGFQHRRAQQLVSLAQDLVDHYEGEVPSQSAELVKLAGVGRKTANVVLGNAFGVPSITVDTHVGRLSRRWGWTQKSNPLQVERDLMEIIPPTEWTVVCHRIILHGRRVCTARNPKCKECDLSQWCPSSEV